MGVVNQRMLGKANQQQISRCFPNVSLAIERLQTTSEWMDYVPWEERRPGRGRTLVSLSVRLCGPTHS